MATAHADTGDAKFLVLVQAQGNHMVCQKLDRGMSPTEAAGDVLNDSSMPAYHSGYFVGAAIEVYCPQHTPEEPKQDGA